MTDAKKAEEASRAAFELRYATAWHAERGGSETVEELAAEIATWRDGPTYPDDLPRLRFAWEGYLWAASQSAAEVAALKCKQTDLLDAAVSSANAIRAYQSEVAALRAEVERLGVVKRLAHAFVDRDITYIGCRAEFQFRDHAEARAYVKYLREALAATQPKEPTPP